jgi:hypothetical protein
MPRVLVLLLVMLFLVACVGPAPETPVAVITEVAQAPAVTGTSTSLEPTSTPTPLPTASFTATPTRIPSATLTATPARSPTPHPTLTVVSPPRLVHPFEPSPATLLYLGSDSNLWLHDLESGERVSLTDDGNTVHFALGPARDRLLVEANSGEAYLLALTSLPDGLYEQMVSLGRIQGEPRWSPDGTWLYYLDERGQAWIADREGASKPLGFSAGSDPQWSSDGSYLAYLIDNDLWLATIDGEPQLIASEIDSFLWSPVEPMLAFNTVSIFEDPVSEIDPEGQTASVYDIVSGQTYLITPKGTVRRWLPDGGALEVTRWDMVFGTGNSWTTFVSDPQGRKLLELGQSYTDEPGVNYLAKEPWIVGFWEVRRDLSGAQRVTERGNPVFWSTDGRYALVLDGDWLTEERHLYFLDRSSGSTHLLMSHVGSGLSHPQNPGIEGQLSPRAEWVLIFVWGFSADYDPIKKVWLMRPDGSLQTEITGQVAWLSWRCQFSPNGRWIVGCESSKCSVYDIARGVSQPLAAGSEPGPVWLKAEP